jgi:hypothetical protein
MYLKTLLLVAAVTEKMTRTTTCIQSVRSNWIHRYTQLLAHKTDRYGPARPFRWSVTASLLAFATASPLLAEVPKQARAVIDQTIGSPDTYIPEEGVYKRIVLPRPEQQHEHRCSEGR